MTFPADPAIPSFPLQAGNRNSKRYTQGHEVLTVKTGIQFQTSLTLALQSPDTTCSAPLEVLHACTSQWKGEPRMIEPAPKALVWPEGR